MYDRVGDGRCEHPLHHCLILCTYPLLEGVLKVIVEFVVLVLDRAGLQRVSHT